VPGTYALGVRRTPDQIDSDVAFSRSCDQGKITEVIERKPGLMKTRFLKKATHLFFLIHFFRKKQIFILF